MSIATSGMSFKEIEAKIQKEAQKYAQEMAKGILEKLDQEIHEKRDKQVYRDKGLRAKCLKTVFGEVTYQRHVYEVAQNDGGKAYVYLLEQELNMPSTSLYSANLVDIMVNESCNNSYREAANSINETTGLYVSHQTVWNTVQNVGDRVLRRENKEGTLAKNKHGRGKKVVPVLFKEKDGIWLNLQGKDREKYSPKREMKVGIAYDGCTKEGKERYRLHNKIAVANIGKASEFEKLFNGQIASEYNMRKKPVICLNGDGAGWIPEKNAIYQLDPFHRNKKLLECITDTNTRKILFDQLYKGEIPQLFETIEAYIDSIEEPAQKEKAYELLKYYRTNEDALISYKKRLKVPAPRKGNIYYRQMGCMESNIFSLIGKRMKARRCNWSIKGANHLASLLCLKATKRLNGVLEELDQFVIKKETMQENVIQVISNYVPSSEGSGYDGYHTATIPGNYEFKWLKDLAAPRWDI